MNVLITGGMGVNGAVTARLLVKEGLRPVLLDNRMDLSLMRDIKDRLTASRLPICDQQALEKTVDAYKITLHCSPGGLDAGARRGQPATGNQGWRRWHGERFGGRPRKANQTSCFHQLQSGLR